MNVDVIVNTTSSDLTLTNGTVSKQLLEKAGIQIQNELKQNYPNGLSQQQSLIAVSSSGNLKHLKYIFHISLPGWNSIDEFQIEKLFKLIINELLTATDVRKCQSIAIPAIGTGILNYPKDKVPKWMYEAINSYLNTTKGKIHLEFVNFSQFFNPLLYKRYHTYYQSTHCLI